MNQQHKIRLPGIDAPKKRQAFGEKSKANLAAMVYGRSVCAVMVSGKDVGLEQVRTGMAWWYRKYAKEQPPEQRVEYEQAEDDARTRRLGLWVDKNPIPPWDWRRGKLAG